MKSPRLFAAGAAHIDRRGQVGGPYVPAASNPGTMREEVGGGAFNAARNAMRHGVDTAIMSVRGGDLAGEMVAQAIVAAGVEDLSATFLDRKTPSYTALIEPSGELIAGLADMGIYEACFTRQLKRRVARDAVASSDAILCDANMPVEAIGKLLQLAGERPLYAIAISPAKVRRLEGVLNRLFCVFMNVAEARALSGLGADATPFEAATALRAAGLLSGVVTAGSGQVTGFDADGLFTVAPPCPRAISDVTGAGDALAGATVAFVMKGMGFREAVRRGVAAAVMTVESQKVVADYDEAAFNEVLALVGEATAMP